MSIAKTCLVAFLSLAVLPACRAEVIVHQNLPDSYLNQNQKHARAVRMYGHRIYLTRSEIAIGTRSRVTERMLRRWGGWRVPRDIMCFPKRRQGVTTVFCSSDRQLSWMLRRVRNPAVMFKKLPQGSAGLENPVYVGW